MIGKRCEEMKGYELVDCFDFLANDIRFDVELPYPELTARHQTPVNREEVRKNIRLTKEEILKNQQNIIEIQKNIQQIKEKITTSKNEDVKVMF